MSKNIYEAIPVDYLKRIIIILMISKEELWSNKVTQTEIPDSIFQWWSNEGHKCVSNCKLKSFKYNPLFIEPLLVMNIK